MNETLFQDIFSLLESVLPNEWKRVAFYAIYTEGSYSMKYYVDFGKGYVDCFTQNSGNRQKIIRTFISIDKVIAAMRKKSDESSHWSVLSLFVDSEGNMKTNYDYTDISGNIIKYEQSWKEKYLNE